MKFCNIALLAFLLVAGLASAWCQTNIMAAGLRIRLPEKWKADDQGSGVRISADDGSVWILKRSDSAGNEAAGDATRSASLKAAAETAANGMLEGARYAGVKSFSVTGGSGAVFRYRGKGKHGADDLVEIWVATGGNGAVFLTPGAAGQPDHGYELGQMLKSVLPLSATGGADSGASQPKGQSSSTRQTQIPAAPAPNKAVIPTPVNTELETYEGHIIAGDASFKLHVYQGTTATAEWEKAVGRAVKYSGSYAGSDGNYAVKMQPAGSDAEVSPLNLTVHSIGGMIHATYTTGDGGPSRNVAELKLTGVYSPNTKLHGGKAGQQARNNQANKNNNRGASNQRRQNGRNNSRRRRTIVIPGIGNPINP